MNNAGSLKFDVQPQGYHVHRPAAVTVVSRVDDELISGLMLAW